MMRGEFYEVKFEGFLGDENVSKNQLYSCPTNVGFWGDAKGAKRKKKFFGSGCIKNMKT